MIEYHTLNKSKKLNPGLSMMLLLLLSCFSRV